MMNVTHLFLAATALAGCAHDLHDRRIPNYLTFGSAIVAVGYHLVTAGWSGLGTATAGWALGIALFLPFFLLRGMGGGDVKLLAALGAWVGPLTLLSLTFYTAIAGGGMALIVIVRRRHLAASLRNFWLLMCHWRVVGIKPLAELSLENKNAPRLAYGLPIAAGALITIWQH
jgi:prepilin peptidase CpaA